LLYQLEQRRRNLSLPHKRTFQMNKFRKTFCAKLASKCEFSSFRGLFDHGWIVCQCWIDFLEHLPPLFNKIHRRHRTILILLNIGLFQGSHGILRRVKPTGINRSCRCKSKQEPQKSR